MGRNRLLSQFRLFLSNDTEALSERAQHQCRELVESLDGSWAS